MDGVSFGKKPRSLLSLSLSHSFPRAAEDAARGGAISPFIGGRHIEST